GRDERWLAVLAEPDHRLRPARGIVRVAAGVAPQYGAPGVGDGAREGVVDPHETLVHEIVDLRGAQGAAGICIIWHGILFAAAGCKQPARWLRASETPGEQPVRRAGPSGLGGSPKRN